MRQLGLLGPGSNQLSRAVGLEEHITVDVLVERLLPNDVYVLCSDGLYRMVSDAQIRDTLLGEQDLEAALYGLLEQANDAGGRDNITVILIRVTDAPERGEARRERRA
jgi:serine/threonine protein phosphatase PrpC